MITLITGKPGMGKTSLLVSMLMELYDGERPVFVMGIPDLKIDHAKCPPVNEWTELRPDPDDPSLMLPYFTFPPDSVVILDEAQRVYRPRSTASKVPDHVAAFETHRHCGIDWILLTQSPKLIDSNVRELVGKHIAIGNRMLGRYLFEWPYVGDIDSKMSREEASKRRFKPPRKAFDQYKSAEVHTKHKFRLHQGFVVLMLALVAFAYFGSRAFGIVHSHIVPEAQAKEAEPPRSGAAAPASHPVVAKTPGAAPGAKQPLEESTDPAAPREVGRPETAPMYDGKLQVTEVPILAGCVASVSKCICYTQQGTRVENTDKACREVAHAAPFNPYAVHAGTTFAASGFHKSEDQHVPSTPAPINPGEVVKFDQPPSPWQAAEQFAQR